MRKYKLYFEFYGRKMQTTVIAKSELEAKQKVKDNLTFLKIVPEQDPVDFLKNMFGM